MTPHRARDPCRGAPNGSVGYSCDMTRSAGGSGKVTGAEKAAASGRLRSGSTSSFLTKNAKIPRVAASRDRKVVERTRTRDTAKAAAGRTAAPRRRAMPGDDPLAAERTRWLSEVVGGSGALADMLGVSRSQTSRWASGQERPGVVSAPLLIDLEHVLARVRLVWSEPAGTTWMTSANAHLGGARPVDALRLHGPGPVLEALDAGAWGSGA